MDVSFVGCAAIPHLFVMNHAHLSGERCTLSGEWFFAHL